jgi:hypothetical protein
LAEDLDDLLVLPLTPGAVEVMEGRQCTPGDALGRMHHPLERPVVAIPGSDTVRQDALNGASVKVVRVLGAKPNFFSLLR